MKYKEKIKWLSRYEHILVEAQSISRQAKVINEKINQPSAKILDGMPKSQSPGSDNKLLFRHLTLQEEADKIDLKAKIIRDEITGAINQLENVQEKQVLMLKYLECKKTREIKQIMHYGHSRVYKIHEEAVNHLNI